MSCCVTTEIVMLLYVGILAVPRRLLSSGLGGLLVNVCCTCSADDTHTVLSTSSSSDASLNVGSLVQ